MGNLIFMIVVLGLIIVYLIPKPKPTKKDLKEITRSGEHRMVNTWKDQSNRRFGKRLKNKDYNGPYM